MRKVAMILGVLLLSIIPVAVLAQEGVINDLVELVFADEQTKVGIVDSFQSTASITVNVDGQEYLVKVPATIDIDSVVALENAVSSYPTGTRVGEWAIEVVEIFEETEEFEYTSPYGTAEELEPSSDANKIVVLRANFTNVGDEPSSPSYFVDGGVDDLGREFNTTEEICAELNPGETRTCTFLFDVDSNVNIVGITGSMSVQKTIYAPQVSSEASE